ncbi:MAG: hypothetical protein M1385_00195 [Candidatus Marsarchaeota archaeon]|nr:hypothetical protein [Candidatus Marsarchaeota archaeon]
MNQKIIFEIKRKSAHMLLTAYPFIFIYFSFSYVGAVLFSFAYISLMLISEYLRINFSMKTPTYYLIKYFSRSIQRKGIKSEWKRYRIPYWIIGSTIALLVFNYSGWLFATVLLSIGDPISGISKAVLGVRRSIFATSIGFAACTIILFIISNNIFLSILPSFFGMLADWFSYKFNDNLTIPIFAAIGSFIARML